MSASDQNNRIVEYLYDELDPAERAAFEQSLETDAALRAEVEGLQETRGLMQQMEDEEPSQALFYELVREARKAVSTEKKPSFIQQLMAALIRPQAATAMLVLIVAGTGLYLLNNNSHRIQEHPGDVVSPRALPERGDMARVEGKSEEKDKWDGMGEPVLEAVELAETTPARTDAVPSFSTGTVDMLASKSAESSKSEAGSGTTDGRVKRSRRTAEKRVEKKRLVAKSSSRRKEFARKKAKPVAAKPVAVANLKESDDESRGLSGLGATALRTEKPATVARSNQRNIVYGGSGSSSAKQVRVSSAAPEAEASMDAPAPAPAQQVVDMADDTAPEKTPEPFDQAMGDYKAQRYGQAIKGFQRVVADKSLSHRVYKAQVHMARAYRKQGKNAIALSQYRQILETNQTATQRRALLLETARLEMKMGKLGVARSHVLQALKGQKKPSPEATALLSQLNQRIEKADRKEADRKKASEKSKTKKVQKSKAAPQK